MEFLARLEVCPAHGPELELCSITGGVEPEETIEQAALQELWEEAGFRANEYDLISLGQVHPSKSADTIVYLFAIDVGGTPQSTPKGDGTEWEKDASVEWVDHKQGVHIYDPLFVTSMTRLLDKMSI
jgi:8-oxo-dGTP pyrophosphatase MutT (NUDIX family)